MLDFPSSPSPEEADPAAWGQGNHLNRLLRLAIELFGAEGVLLVARESGTLSSWVVVGDGGLAVSNSRAAAVLIDRALDCDQPVVVSDLLSDHDLSNITEAPPPFRFFAAQTLPPCPGRPRLALCLWSGAPQKIPPDHIALLEDVGILAAGELLHARSAKALEHLRESREHYRYTVELNPQIPWTAGTDGMIVFATERWKSLVGMSVGEGLGSGWLQAVHPEDRGPVTLLWSQAVQSGEPYDAEFRVRVRDGRYRWYRSRAQARYDEKGKIVLWYGTLEDIDDRKRAESALRESEQRLALALESSSQAVWDWNVKSDTLGFYGQVFKDFGYSEELLEQRSYWMDLVHPQDRELADAVGIELRDGKRSIVRNELRLRCADGSYRWVADEGKVVERDADGKASRVIGTIKDIHVEKQQAMERQRTAERMSLAMEAGGVGVYEIDLSNGSVIWDERMCQLFGVSADFEPTLDRIADLLHPDNRAAFHQVIEDLRMGRRVSVQAEHRLVNGDGQERYVRVLGRVSEPSADSPLIFVGIGWDVTQARELKQQLSHQATHDSLTGLVNRTEFERRLKEVLWSARLDKSQHVVGFVDLDRFKFINDTAGHAAGDSLLRQLSEMMAQQMDDTHLLARVGGDEFGLLLPGSSLSLAADIAQRLLDAVEAFSFEWQGHVYRLGVSIGLAALSADSESVDDTINQADMACYAAKRAGRNRVSIYNSREGEASVHHQQLRVAAGIRKALEEGRFCLHAQPIVPTMSTGVPSSCLELLVRMRDRDEQLVSPAEFIPAAEQYGLMNLVDRWVLSEALTQFDARMAAIPGLAVSLNLSADSLNDPAFPAFIEELIANSRLPAERIHFEITETAAVVHLASAIEIVSRLRRAGCSIALDDFGSGLSSFRYLKEFPIDYIKIDGSFIRQLEQSEADRAIVESICGIARRIGARTVAEFVETEALLAQVTHLGVDFAQGYGIGRPQPLETALEQMVEVETAVS